MKFDDIDWVKLSNIFKKYYECDEIEFHFLKYDSPELVEINKLKYSGEYVIRKQPTTYTYSELIKVLQNNGRNIK